MSCNHSQLTPRNLAELLPVYECDMCGARLVCLCEAAWFKEHDFSRYQSRLKEADVADNICVACRGLPDMVAAYGRSLFSRRHWREIYQRKLELLEAAALILDDLRIKWEEAERQLRAILWVDFSANRWGSFLRQATSGGTPLEEISDANLRRSVEVSNWRTVRNGLLREIKEGRSLLKGEALAVLARLQENYDGFYARVQEIDEEAENIVRQARGIPLIGQGWISETELFNLVRDAVAPVTVVQHARFSWLGSQHLDIYVPDRDLAIEYMGEQHFRPVEFFGGEEALRKRKTLDKRKAQLCRENGVRLIYVTPDDEVSVDAVEKILARGETMRMEHAPKSV